ncbi:TPA: DJ-1 family protein [bacterium]|nr:DJ-1 family protein [bacterium]
MELLDKKVCMVVASSNFRDEEFLEPKKIFEDTGIKVVVASSELGISKGYFGATANIDILVEDINVDEFDAIVFVGGSGSQEYFNNPRALKIAKDAFDKNKTISAICIAPSILANAGVLTNKRTTAFSSEKANLTRNGAIWTGSSVEVDGNIITADGPGSAKEFGRAILNSLSK